MLSSLPVSPAILGPGIRGWRTVGPLLGRYSISYLRLGALARRRARQLVPWILEKNNTNQRIPKRTLYPERPLTLQVHDCCRGVHLDRRGILAHHHPTPALRGHGEAGSSVHLRFTPPRHPHPRQPVSAAPPGGGSQSLPGSNQGLEVHR